MRRIVHFNAYGHPNVVGEHASTIELTRENSLTKSGTCIVGVRSTLVLSDLDEEIRGMVRDVKTRITLEMTTGTSTERIRGWGSSGLTYSDLISMVARTSSFECGRTLMVGADKAASDLERSFVDSLKNVDASIDCKLTFVTR